MLSGMLEKVSSIGNRIGRELGRDHDFKPVIELLSKAVIKTGVKPVKVEFKIKDGSVSFSTVPDGIVSAEKPVFLPLI